MSEEELSPYRALPEHLRAPAPQVEVKKTKKLAKFALPVYAARRCLRDGVNAAHAGQIDEAMASMRGYIVLRAKRMSSSRPTQADAEAAMLAATCAALRCDAIELNAVRALITNSDTTAIQEAREWIEVMVNALAGDLPAVATRLGGEVSPIVSPLRPAILVLAAERGAERADPQLEPALLALLDEQLGDEASGRVLVVLARAALARRDVNAAMAFLRDIPAAAGAYHAFCSALASGRDTLARAWSSLPDDDRPRAAAFAATFAACSTSATARQLYEICQLSSVEARGVLLGVLAGALVREGSPLEALHLVEDGKDAGATPAARVAKCHALVALDRASEALGDVVTGEGPCSVRERDLALVVASAARDGERVARLLAKSHEIAPSAPARTAVLIFAATAGAEVTLPAWAESMPDDPDGQYAWGLLETRRGRGSAALPAFTKALAARPDLAVEPVDVARLQAAREAVRSANLVLANGLLDKVKSPRFEREAALLRAMALIRAAAAREQTRLDPGTLGPVVRSLLATLPADGRDHQAVALLAREADELRARWLLRRERVGDARPIVKRLGDDAFLGAVLAILEHQPVDAIERELATAGDAPLAGVLLAEVRGSKGDVAARVELLEQIRARGAGGGTDDLVDEALVVAYQSARRGLDAKRIALDEVRQSGKLGGVLATELREALAFEAPPDRERPVVAPVQAQATLPADAVGGRARMLGDLVARRKAGITEAWRREAIDINLAAFHKAMRDNDAKKAAAAERAVLAAFGGGP